MTRHWNYPSELEPYRSRRRSRSSTNMCSPNSCWRGWASTLTLAALDEDETTCTFSAQGRHMTLRAVVRPTALWNGDSAWLASRLANGTYSKPKRRMMDPFPQAWQFFSAIGQY